MSFRRMVGSLVIAIAIPWAAAAKGIEPGPAHGVCAAFAAALTTHRASIAAGEALEGEPPWSFNTEDTSPEARA